MTAHNAPRADGVDRPRSAEYVAAETPERPGDMCGLTVGSLFSGIGGIDLGLERAGMRVIWQSEVDDYASKVLAKHWPDVPNLGDITKIDWSEVERPDVVAGGFPCQPWSVAGRRLGVEDERHLWPEFARCLRELRPRYAVMENVPGLLVRGMGDVLGDLASLGFDAEWQGIPAAAVGAPHLRWRIFILAHAQRNELRQQPVAQPGGSGTALTGHDGPERALADTDGAGLSERRRPESVRAEHHPPQRRRQDVAYAADGRGQRRWSGPGTSEGWRPFRVPPGPSSGDGWWAVEPELGRVANGIPARVDRLRCLGNAVVPQVAEYVGRQLVAAHNALAADPSETLLIDGRGDGETA